MSQLKKIKVETEIKSPVSKVWEYYTNPEHIVKWNNASDDWHTPKATNDLKVGGKFSSRMESKDGAHGFDFEGTYTDVKENELISYVMSDNREVSVMFEDKEGKTNVEVIFDAESENSEEMQRDGWQSILDNFKKYVEAE